MSQRTEQIASVLRRALQRIIDHKLSDPRLKGKVTITQVGIDTEFTFAKVQITISPESAETVTLGGLQAATGHIRSLLRSEIEIRRIPQINFRIDEGLKREQQVLAAINEAVRDLPEPESDPPAEDEENTTSKEGNEQ
jgi:ribosome-binding factor A